tara:strand:- start:109 stop:561 length:453 start_codon:yes stop_codon:yes gene_type:complete
MTIKAVLAGREEPVMTTEPDATSVEAAKLLSDRRIGLLVVCDTEGKIAGVLSERDIVRGLADHGAGLSEKRVADLMTGDVLTCSPGDLENEVLDTMAERQIRHMPVVDSGNLVGMVSIRDLMTYLMEHDAARMKDKMLSIYRKSGFYPGA